jgi:hypothetical protein
MSKVLITGSADGLGREAAKQLARGYDVVLHARGEARAHQASAGVPGAALPGDPSSITSTRALADLINAAAVFDAIIHNAGIGYREPTRRETEDGLEHVSQTNVLAPYLLTVLVNRPPRLIYLSSGLHRSGDPDLADLQRGARALGRLPGVLRLPALRRGARRRGRSAVGRRRQQLRGPRLGADEDGGPGARGEIGPGAGTQVWLATSNDPLALHSGRHFHHRRLRETHPAVADPVVQDGLLAGCYELTGQAITDSTPTTHVRESR